MSARASRTQTVRSNIFPILQCVVLVGSAGIFETLPLRPLAQQADAVQTPAPAIQFNPNRTSFEIPRAEAN